MMNRNNNDYSVFYMIYGEQRAAPTKKHQTWLEAHRECKRLAEDNPGRKFYVLRAEHVYKAEVPTAHVRSLGG